MSALRSRNKRTRPGKPAPILIELHRPAAPPGKLKCIGGSRSDTWNLQLANQVVATLGLTNSDEEDSQKRRNGAIDALIGIGPRDELEGMIAAQLLAAHNAAMECYRRAMIGEQTPEGRREALTIAAVLDGASREEAAKIGGMDRQTLRDWVIRFNEQGPDGLINVPSPGAPGKLNDEHKTFLARIVEEGPMPAVHGVVRWRACDLIMRLYEEFGLSVSDDTIYRALKNLGFSHVSARPQAYKQDPEVMRAFKKTSPTAWRKSVRSSLRARR